MVTRYYNAAVDDNWSTAGNWWTDAGHTVPLGGLPATTDSVVLSAALSEAAYEATVVNLTTSYDLELTLTCTLATFNSTAIHGSFGVITGAAVFNGTSQCAGAVVGNVTFNNSATHEFGSSIVGTVIFNDTSQANAGYISGNVTFNDTSIGTSGTIAGNVTLNDSADLQEINVSLLYTITCNDLSKITATTAVISATCTFNDDSYSTSTVITGDCVFNDDAQNRVASVITGTVTFNDNSENLGTVTGNAKAYHPVVFPLGGTVTGAIDYYGYNFANGICQSSFAGTGFLNFVSTVNLPAGVCLTKFTNTIPLLFATLTVPQGTSNVKFTCQGRLSVPDTGFTVSQAVNEIVDIWGGCGGSCDNKKLAQALNIINACLQEIYLNAKQLQYLSNETITVLLTGQDQGMDYFELPDTVQAVVGPVFYNTDDTERMIPGLKSKGQVLQWSKLYQTPGKSPVMAYWVESTGQLEGERCNVRLYTPTNPFSGETTVSVTLDIQREIPRYTESDCRNGVRPPLPHKYAESLLLPLIREKASASPHCSRRDSAPLYQADAAAARKLYGMADPQNPAVDGTLAAPTP